MAPSKVQQLKMDGYICQIVDKELASIQEFDRLEAGVTGGITVSLIYCDLRKGWTKSLAVRPGSDKVGFADINTADEHQQWVLNDSYGRINGEEQGTFALVNMATGLALLRSRVEGKYHLNLIKFDDIRYQDESALWKKGWCVGKDGFGRIDAATDDCYLTVDDANNVVLRKPAKRFALKFGGSSARNWKIIPLP